MPQKADAVDSATTAQVHLFTDGGCSGNPGPGGWGFILRHVSTGKEKEQSGGVPETTNNRMELTAVIEGLATLKRPCRVELFTDSVYVGDPVRFDGEIIDNDFIPDPTRALYDVSGDRLSNRFTSDRSAPCATTGANSRSI